MLGLAPGTGDRWVGVGRRGCTDEIQMTGIQEFTFLGRNPFVDGTIFSDRTNFEF
jgi:hypothetical protein